MGNDGSYDDYLGQLKSLKIGFDDQKMLARIEVRAHERNRGAGLLLSGALGVFLVSIIFYLSGQQAPNSSGGIMAKYVFQQNNSYDDPVLDYVFMD